MLTLRSVALFIAAAVCEIGGAWLIWQGIREHRGWAWIGGGVVALSLDPGRCRGVHSVERRLAFGLRDALHD